MPSGVLSVVDLGLKEYGEALTLQRALREERIAGRVDDTLLLLEHPPTITLGRRAAAKEMRLPEAELKAQGFGIWQIERGGKSTYHGPGQLVGYPIVDVRARGLSVPRYVHLLEEAIIAYLGSVGQPAARREGYPGVWVNGNKIAAVGVHLKQWVSIHGFALNVDPDMRHFETIVACGIGDAGVTSMARELRRDFAMSDVKAAVARSLSETFGYGKIQWHNAVAFPDGILQAKA
ncbi:MAG: lipoyl(octanoyl) transferase LipB [Chloroflexi bacterium]|nr:lipoyl(octanoyl) transferase LipB [Chloroflexota bacterium]